MSYIDISTDSVNLKWKRKVAATNDLKFGFYVLGFMP